MLRSKRRWYTSAERAEMWDRWQRGESLNAIARAFETSHSAISKNFGRYGGIRPPDRQRSRLALTLSEREEISRGIVSGLSLRTIARQLDRAPSTISREVNRNGGLRRYRANQADQAAWDRAHRPKPCKLAGNLPLRRLIASKLKRHWSPEQIAGWLKKVHAGNEKLQVSHETIYRSLFIQARGALKRELLQYLRSKRVMRYPQKSSLKEQGLGQITDAVSIRERPAEAEDRAVPGHWEGDLLFGSNNSQIATLVERHTRYVILARVKRKDTETVITALIKQAHKLPRELYKSLTWDRGKEMADHQRFTLDTNIQVYFCDPKSPWQRGSNENTNGLLRQYFPKGMDLSDINQNRLNAVARQLNERPRKTLGYYSPAEKFSECVASIN
ncbi:MAG: IS30 family transposase [Gammaproteobacteria bacterium]|nr:MAG: IS30 family transposase [Gammaproteobacteria bacterium]